MVGGGLPSPTPFPCSVGKAPLLKNPGFTTLHKTLEYEVYLVQNVEILNTKP